MKTRTVLRSKEKARQRKAKAAAKRRRIERRRLVINFREIDLTEEDADLIDEEDVDLLLEVAQSNPVNLEEYQEELCKEGCSEEQAKVMAQVLLGATPWESLGVDHTATEQECTTNFRKISRWIHPDKCTHPKAAETFKKLAEAHEWSKDKVQWEAKQAQSAARKQWVDSQMQAWNLWVATGGNVFSIQTDEALWREACSAEETLELIWLHESHEWDKVTIESRAGMEVLQQGAGYPRRNRTRTQWYQSTEEDEKEKERRKKKEAEHEPTDDPESEGEEMEEDPHDWKEGERMGEAKNPGPPANYNPPWTHAPGLRQEQAQAQARWHGTRAVPNAPAGEYAKGMYPGPNPSSAGVGPDPRRNTGCNYSSTNMSTNYMSRAGTAQHTQGQVRYTTGRWCKYGVHCYGKQGRCPFQHPQEMHKQCRYGMGCRKRFHGCPFLHTEEGRWEMEKPFRDASTWGTSPKGWCKYGENCRKKDRGCPFLHHPQSTRGLCKFGAQCKKQTCLYKHPRNNYNGWDPHLSGMQLGQSHNWCGPNNGGNNRLAQSQHQWSTVGKASSDPAPCRAGFHPDTHCRREHLPHNFDAQNVWAQHPGRTGRAETGAETVPIWNNIKQPGLNGLWYDEYPATWKDDNYWTPLQNKSQRRNSAPGSSNQSHCAQRGILYMGVGTLEKCICKGMKKCTKHAFVQEGN